MRPLHGTTNDVGHLEGHGLSTLHRSLELESETIGRRVIELPPAKTSVLELNRPVTVNSICFCIHVSEVIRLFLDVN
jgi:hypothetical protein